MPNLIERLLPIATDHRDAIASLAGFVEKVRAFLAGQVGQPARGFQPIPPYAGTPLTLLAADPQAAEARAAEHILLQDMQRRWETIQNLTSGYEGILYRMAFIYRVALFDALIPDALTAVVLTESNILKRGKTLTFEEILEHVQAGSLIEFMAEKVITPVAYLSVAKQAEWIKDKLSIELVSNAAQLHQLIEIMARRNLFAHANGVVNRTYLELVPNAANAVGDHLGVDYDYWYKANILLRDICSSLLRAITIKFASGEQVPNYLEFE